MVWKVTNARDVQLHHIQNSGWLSLLVNECVRFRKMNRSNIRTTKIGRVKYSGIENVDPNGCFMPILVQIVRGLRLSKPISGIMVGKYTLRYFWQWPFLVRPISFQQKSFVQRKFQGLVKRPSSNLSSSDTNDWAWESLVRSDYDVVANLASLLHQYNVVKPKYWVSAFPRIFLLMLMRFILASSKQLIQKKMMITVGCSNIFFLLL